MRPATCQSQQQPHHKTSDAHKTHIYIYTYAYTTHIYKYTQRRMSFPPLSTIHPTHTYIDLLSPFFFTIFFLFCSSRLDFFFLSERYVIRNRLSVIARLTTARQQSKSSFRVLFLLLLLSSLNCFLGYICDRQVQEYEQWGGRNQPTYREFVSDDGKAGWVTDKRERKIKNEELDSPVSGRCRSTGQRFFLSMTPPTRSLAWLKIVVHPSI